MWWSTEIGKLTPLCVFAAWAVSGCATPSAPYWKETAYGTWDFSPAEVERLPKISVRRILSLASAGPNQRIQVLVKARKLDGTARVRGLSGPREVDVTDAHGREMKIAISGITDIRTTRSVRVVPRHEASGQSAQALGVFALYAPLIPVAAATGPLLGAMGLDARRNARDNEKASVAYVGLSRAALIRNLGEPRERYRCDGRSGSGEVWIYDPKRVLRGGRALFIASDKGVVYHTSHNTSFFKKSSSMRCSLDRSSSSPRPGPFAA